jgi:hypothetical protein
MSDFKPGLEGVIAFESIERGGSVEEIVARRRGTLEAKAYGLCLSKSDERAFTVVFEYANPSGTQETGRGVTMSSRFDRLRVQHVDFLLVNVSEGRAGCTLTPGG